MGKGHMFPSVCKQNALFYEVVVLLAPLTGTLLNRDYSCFLLSLFSFLELQEGMCKTEEAGGGGESTLGAYETIAHVDRVHRN